MSRDWFEGWPGQYRRMLRWRDRGIPLLSAGESVDADALYDFTYAFFQSAYDLRDWLLSTGSSRRQRLDALFNSSIELQLCRDICNASKHLKYDRPSVDSRPRISREFDPWSRTAGDWCLYSDQRRPVRELMQACVNAWDAFLEHENMTGALRRPRTAPNLATVRCDTSSVCQPTRPWSPCNRRTNSRFLSRLLPSTMAQAVKRMSMEPWISVAVTVGSTLLAAGIAVRSWHVGHQRQIERDRISKRRDLRLGFLIDAYRRLEFVSNRPITPDTSKDFEKAIADIQLFGAASQVELAREFAVRFARDGTAPLDPLLSALRHDLREELLLDDIPREITYLRMTFDPQRKSAAPSFPPKRE